MNNCLYVNSEEELSTTQNNLNCLDSCVSDFKYPDGPFFTEEQKQRLVNNTRNALPLLDDASQTIVIFKIFHPESTLRQIAALVNLSHEGVRWKIKKINEIYPIFGSKCSARKRKLKLKKWFDKNNQQSLLSYAENYTQDKRYFLDSQQLNR